MAVRHAVELEAFNKAERKHLEGQGYMRATNQQETNEQSKPDEYKTLQESVLKMQKTLERLSRQNNSYDSSDKNRTQAGNRESGQRRASTKDQPGYKRKCWTCGSEKQIRRNCPQTEHKTVTGDKDQQMKQETSCGAGFYVKCKVNGVLDESFSTRLWDTIQQCSSPLLETFYTQVFTASCEPVEIKGQTSVILDIGGMQYACKVVVADIDLDLIMGLDFFKDHNCQIDIVRNVLTIDGKPCEMTCSGAVGCYRLSVAKKVQIPAMSEMIIDGKVEDGRIHPKGLCIIEPKEQSPGNSELLVARSLCYYKQSNPIRVTNLTNEDQIFTHSKISSATPVSGC